MGAKSQESQFSYDAARKRLQEILSELQADSPSIDELGRQVREAVQLIKDCRRFLSETEMEVTQALGEVASPTSSIREPDQSPPADDDMIPLKDDDVPF